MMRLFSIVVLFLCLSAQAASLNVYSPGMLRFMPGTLGDSRVADESKFSFFDPGFPGLFDFELPTGEWTSMSVTFWIRVTSTNHFQSNINRIPFSQYCPEPIRWTMPDLLGGVCAAETGGTNLIGTVSVAYSFPAETSPAAGNCPKGIYTVSGWASNETTVVVGGNSITVGPGTFKTACYPGDASGISVRLRRARGDGSRLGRPSEQRPGP